MQSINLYFHIPFCKRRCKYCAFYSIKWHKGLENEYIDAILQELDLLSPNLKNKKITSLYFGGGTPSLIDSNLIGKIIGKIKRNYLIDKNIEITLEANPESVSLQKLIKYYKVGINRLSIGLQAWQDELLLYFGRLHDRKAFLNAFAWARIAGFSNINVDLIFGIPNQTLGQWQKSLEELVKLGPEHISCYSLELNNASALGMAYEHGRLKPINDEDDRKMYYLAKKMLGNAEYNHYEISNFSKKGFECKHNFDFWNQNNFVGIGAGAYSYLDGQHHHHPEDVTSYIHNPSFKIIDKLENENDKKQGFVMLGLRLVKGFSIDTYKSKFSSNFKDDYASELEKLSEYKLINITDSRVKLTSKGLDLYDLVIRELLFSKTW